MPPASQTSIAGAAKLMMPRLTEGASAKSRYLTRKRSLPAGNQLNASIDTRAGPTRRSQPGPKSGGDAGAADLADASAGDQEPNGAEPGTAIGLPIQPRRRKPPERRATPQSSAASSEIDRHAWQPRQWAWI